MGFVARFVCGKLKFLRLWWRNQLATTAQKVSEDSAPLDWTRIRFIACLSVYGGSLGAMAVLVSVTGKSEFLDLPNRLSIGASILFWFSGFFSGAILAVPFAYFVLGRPPRFYKEKLKRRPNSLLKWVMLGLAFGAIFPFVAGGTSVPFTQTFFRFWEGIVNVPSLLITIFDLASGVWAAVMFYMGVRLLFSSIVAGLLFGIGSWGIDRLNLSNNRMVAQYGSSILTVVLSMAITLAVVFQIRAIVEVLA